MPQEQIQDVSFTEIELIPLLRKAIDPEKLAGLMAASRKSGCFYPTAPWTRRATNTSQPTAFTGCWP